MNTELTQAWDDLAQDLKTEQQEAEEQPQQEVPDEAQTIVVLDESEVEDEDPAAEKEPERVAPAAPAPQTQVPADVPLFQMPETPPVSVEQAANHYYAQSMVYALKRNGVELRDDGADLAEKEREAYERDPKGYLDIRDWARTNAQTQAEHYRKEHIEPYRQVREQNQVIGFLNRFQRECPDVVELIPEMKALQAEVFARWPELADEPRLAVPILYQRAKERRLAGMAAQARPVAPRMETGGGGARTSKTAPVKRDPLKLLMPERAPTNMAKLLDLM